MPTYLVLTYKMVREYTDIVVSAPSEGAAFSAISGVDGVMMPPYKLTTRAATIIVPIIQEDES